MTRSIEAQLKNTTDQQLAIDNLLNDYLIKVKGEPLTVYTILRHVSDSGLTRNISLKVVQDNNIYDITYSTALALGDKIADFHGYNTIKVSGCGMDMGFHLVYNLSSVLFAGQDRAGYKLNHRWL
jgi:hypothetical protein